jgi:TolA-binding protein
MNNYTDIILKYQSGEMTNDERDEFDRNRILNEELRIEFEFQEKIDEIMKISLLLEEIENDPELTTAEILAQNDIVTYQHRNGEKKDKRTVQKDLHEIEVETESELQRKIAKAEVEIALHGIDEISEVWVKNFDEKKPSIEEVITAQRIHKYVNESDPFSEDDILIPSVRRRINIKTIFMAIAAVLVFSLLLFKALTPSYTSDSVYKQYYEPLEANSFNLRGNSNEEAGKLQTGVDYYLSKNYTKAELVFDELLKKNENVPEARLYSGLNQMGKGNFANAINLFTDIISADDQYIPEAQWYLGLCYIKTGENVKARSLFETMSETEGIYKKKAQRILKNINR